MCIKPALVLAVSLSLSLSVPALTAPPKCETVYGLARVNGQSKKVAGKTYQLVALYSNPFVLLLNTNATNVELLVNGKPLSGWEMPLAPGEKLSGKDDLRMQVLWMALPEKGEMEVLLGPVHFDTADIPPAAMRKQILQGGFVPYKVDVGAIPSVQAATTKELVERMEKQFGKH